LTKPRLVYRSGVWCVEGSPDSKNGYLFDLALAWSVAQWRKANE
jgi:hypothetical protein